MSNKNIEFIKSMVAVPNDERIPQLVQAENIARNNWLREFLEEIGLDGRRNACDVLENKINKNSSGEGSRRMKKRGTRRKGLVRKRRVRKRSNGKTRGRSLRRSRGRSLRRTRGKKRRRKRRRR
jgi:hypothetical protein